MGTWFVTGGTGFIGQHVLTHLVHAGHHPKALVRRDPPVHLPETIEWVHGDLHSTSVISSALRDCDGIIHLAGLIKARSPREYFRVNGEGTAHLVHLAATLNRPIRFIYISSLAAAGPSKDGQPVDESKHPEPISTYGASKLAGENAVRSAPEHVNWTILRPPAVYGPGDRATLPYFRLIAWRIFLFLGDPGRPFSLIYGPDLARAIVHILDHPNTFSETFFVTHPDIMTWESLAHLIAETMGRQPVLRLTLPPRLLYSIGLLNESIARLAGRTAFLSREKFREILHPGWICSGIRLFERTGFQPPTPHKEGIHETIQWYRKHKWL